MLTQMFVLSLTPPAFEAAVVGGGEEEEQEVEQEQEGFLRVYTETGPYAAFDRYSMSAQFKCLTGTTYKY
jgi:hypothetical protein